MAVRIKTRRRLRIAVGVCLLCVVAGATAYFIRKQQQAAQVLRDRDIGYAALAQQDYYTALHKIGPYITWHPNDVEALLKYATARAQVPEPNGKHITQSLAFLRRILELKPDYAEARGQLLELYTQYGLNTEVLALTDGREDNASRKARILAHARLRQFQSALELAEKLCKADPLDLEQQIIALDLMRQSGKTAEELLQRADALAKEHPNDARFELLQSIALQQAGKSDDAIKLAQQAAEHGSSDPQFVPALVDHLDRLQKFDQALAVLQRAAAVGADKRFERAAAARLYQAGSDEQVLLRTRGLDAGDPRADLQMIAVRAMSLTRLGRKDEAVELVRALRQRGHDATAQAWVNVLNSVLFSSEHDDREVIQSCVEALKTAGESPFFHFFLGEAYSRLSESASAMIEWQESALQARSWAAPFTRMSCMLAAQGNIKGALELAQEASKRNPDDRDAMTALALAKARAIPEPNSKEVAEVLTLIDEIRQRWPGDEQTLILKVSLLAKLGRKDDAVTALRQALSSAPPPSSAALVQLAITSKEAGLGTQEECLAFGEKTHGPNAALAYARATERSREGQPEEGLKLFDAAQARSVDPRARSWQLARAQYLELITDRRAKESWVALAEAFPRDATVQWQALAAASVRAERSFCRSTIDRLGSIIGDQGIGWRIADAQWRMESADPIDLRKATSILADVNRRDSANLTTRSLLAACFERLGKTDDAIEQLYAAVALETRGNAAALQVARLLQGKGDFAKAQTILDRIDENLRRLPAGDVSAHAERRTLAELFAQRGQSDRAIAVLKQTDAPDDKAVDLQLATLLWQREYLTEEICRKLLTQPTPQAIFLAADFYAVQGRDADARQALQRLDQLTAPPGAKELARAQYYGRHGTDAQVVEQLSAATRLAPKNRDAWKALVIQHVIVGRAPETIAAIRAAHEAIPGDQNFAQLADESETVEAVVHLEPAKSLTTALLDATANERASGLDALKLLSTAKKSNQPLGALVPQLRPLAERAPTLLPLQLLIAEMYLAINKPEDAEKLATKAMEIFPTSPEPARVAARALAAQGRWPEALSAAQQWHQREGGSAAAPVAAMLAAAHLALGDPSAGLKDLEPHVQAAVHNPKQNEFVLPLYLQARVALNQPREAADVVASPLPQSAPLRSAWMQLAGQFIPDITIAESWLMQVEPMIDPSSVPERVMLAESWRALANRTKLPAHAEAAARVMEEAARELQSAPRSTAEEWEAMGMLYEAAGKHDAAEPCYRRALSLVPDSPLAANNLAMILTKRGGNLDEALSLAQRAALHRDDLRCGSFLDTLATVQFRLKQYDAAASSLAEAVKLNPQNLDWQIRLARALLEAGRRDQAEARLDLVEQQANSSNQLSSASRDELARLRQIPKSSD